MKKRLYAAIYIAVMFMILSCVSGYTAEINTYILDEIGLSVDIPDNYAVVTRDINENDSSLTVFNRTKDDMLSFMNTNNIYLDAFDAKSQNEIVVTMTDNDLMDFNNISDDMLLEVIEEFKSSYESNGATYIKSDIYDNGQIKFIKIYANKLNGDNTVYGLQYYTVYNNKLINIILYSYTNQITGEAETEIKNIVNSVNFDVGVETSDTTSLVNGYEYIDNDTGLSFIVPANYTQQELSADRYFIKAKFVRNDKNDVCILYGSTDIFGEMPKEEKRGVRRDDFNNSILSEEDVAEMYGIKKDEIKKVVYGNKEYYKCTLQQTDDSTGIEIQVDVIVLMHIENGYMYTFQFAGRENSPYYTDFERLLSNVKYPEINAGRLYLEDLSRRILFGFILTIIIYSLPIIIYRYAIHRKPVKPSVAKKITLIYGIGAFIVMSVVLILLGGRGAGTAIILWSYINYRMLISGYTVNYEGSYNSDNSEPQIEKSKTREVFFYHTCTKCGSKFKVRYNMPEYKTAMPDLETVCPKCRTRQMINSDSITDLHIHIADENQTETD